MKLLTYNFLTSKCIRGVKVGYPLKLNVIQQTTTITDFNAAFIARLLPKLDWPTVCAGADMCGGINVGELPRTIPETASADNDFLQKLHHILLEIDIIEGNMECPETGRIFPITDGIPNMLLNEDEV